MGKPAKVQGIDLPIVKLTPLKKRPVTAKNYAKLVANLKAVGLIQPLCVCRDGDQYLILDGYIRFLALLELGVTTVPCLLLDNCDIYTSNRQVNHLSPHQEAKILREALVKLDKKTIADAFGIESLDSRLGMGMRKDLHAEVLKALESGQLQQQVARELAYVLHKRQLEIMQLMKQSGDWTLPFVKAQILNTPPALRGHKRRRNSPWEQHEDKKRNLVKKLQEVEKHHDFYSGLYRQYVADLLKLAIYVRQILTRPSLHAYLTSNHPDMLTLFESVLKESEEKAAV